VASATPNITAAVTVALAASTTPRRGLAMRVAPMVPVAYSLDMTRTPKLAATSRPKVAPVRLPPRTVSSGWRLRVAPTNTAMPRTKAAIAASVHRVDRTVRNLVHSEASPSVKPARPASTFVRMSQPPLLLVVVAGWPGTGSVARYSTLVSVICT
jgi:hypothetical protein